MQLTHSLEARQQQTQRIDPRQILASEIMAWTTAELESAVDRELSENPALETRDGETLTLATGETMGYGNLGPAPPVPGSAEPRREEATGTYSQPNFTPTGDETDPLERVASHLSLREQLRRQVGQVSSGKVATLVRYLIECVDDRGYLVADTAEVAEKFRVSRGDVDLAIRALQNMDPPGIGARDLRECLVLQVEFLEQNGECHPLARRLLTQCWDDLTAHREERIASRLKASGEQVRAAILFLQKALTPYPGGLARESWQGRPGGNAPAVRPDIVFQRGEAGFTVELARDYEALLNVAPLWRRLAEKPPAQSDDAMRRYVRDHVERAQAFMTGISRRGQTLRRIAAQLVRHQQGFLDTGNRAFLRPLTRQSLAEALGLDESVISRAVADKWAQLPGGEIVPLDAFFGNAHAVREALANLVASENPSSPYSDEELADLLTARGFPLARRTVAKYRGLEKILPARLRRRAPGRVVREKAV
jgi:RNA polymerase sigma-54 factor